MSKKIIEADLTASTWYKIPQYKVLLVRDSNTTSDKKTIRQPVDVVNMLKSYLDGVDREHFAIAMLDRKGNVLGINTVSVGGLHSSIVHPREVYKPAVIIGAASIILCHNHPSGDPEPSQADIAVTNKLVEAGRIMGIEVLDHIILGDDYYSFKERGLI